MRKLTKTVSALLTVAMLMSVVICTPFTVSALTSGDYEYTILDDSTAEITYYNGKVSELSVPSELDGYKVTSIGESAFNDCFRLTNVIIPDSVTKIGNGAFGGCINLVSIIIPNSVTEIGDYAFSDCSSLSSIEIPTSVTRIGKWAFEHCVSLTSIIISNSVKIIDSCIFWYCSSLTSITIPNSVKSIDISAFWDCPSLKSINVDNNNVNYSSLDGVLFDKKLEKLIFYPVGKDEIIYNIPDNVIHIGSCAFYECTRLKNIVIHEKVKSIGDFAFKKCTNIKNITIPKSVISIGYHVFEECYDLTIYGYKDSTAQKYAYENFLDFVTLGEITGDINGDGSITVLDATTLQKYISGLVTLSDEQLALADTNGDGSITVLDATAIQKYIAGLATELG